MIQGRLDQPDARLLDAIQQSFPLLARPFAAIGQKSGQSESEVIRRIAALKDAGLIRQISAIFDSKALGYTSSLVAARVDEDQIDAAAAVINLHPGVSHNYRRDHAYNLWYTLSLPPESQLGLEQTARILHEKSGAIATRLLPTLRLYKIGVKFRMSDDSPEEPEPTQSPDATASALHIPGARARLMIRILQQDLPITPQPFEQLAQEAGIPAEELLAAAGSFQERKVMRRFGAVLHHRQAGFSANAMGVWVVPPDKQDDFGRLAAGFAQVSHCYLRPTYQDWPYSIFTMVHARTREECQEILARISRAGGITDYAALYSTREYKKVRVKYFTGDVEEWEKTAAPVAPPPKQAPKG